MCTKRVGCNGKKIRSYLDFPKANLVTIDFRNKKLLYTAQNLKLLKRLGIIRKMSWLQYQTVIMRLLLNPSLDVQKSVQTELSYTPSRWFSVAVHIRCAGNLANVKERTQMVSRTKLPYIAKMVRSILKSIPGNQTKTVCIATDSTTALKILKRLLYPNIVVSNRQVQRGHSTGAKLNIVHSTMTDLFLLTRSRAFIGVQRSGFSNVAVALSRPRTVRWII